MTVHIAFQFQTKVGLKHTKHKKYYQQMLQPL